MKSADPNAPAAEAAARPRTDSFGPPDRLTGDPRELELSDAPDERDHDDSRGHDQDRAEDQ